MGGSSCTGFFGSKRLGSSTWFSSRFWSMALGWMWSVAGAGGRRWGRPNKVADVVDDLTNEEGMVGQACPSPHPATTLRPLASPRLLLPHIRTLALIFVTQVLLRLSIVTPSHCSSSTFDLTGVCTINVRRESATCAAASTVVSPALSHTGDTSTGPSLAAIPRDALDAYRCLRQ